MKDTRTFILRKKLGFLESTFLFRKRPKLDFSKLNLNLFSLK